MWPQVFKSLCPSTHSLSSLDTKNLDSLIFLVKGPQWLFCNTTTWFVPELSFSMFLQPTSLDRWRLLKLFLPTNSRPLRAPRHYFTWPSENMICLKREATNLFRTKSFENRLNFTEDVVRSLSRAADSLGYRIVDLTRKQQAIWYGRPPKFILHWHCRETSLLEFANLQSVALFFYADACCQLARKYGVALTPRIRRWIPGRWAPDPSQLQSEFHTPRSGDLLHFSLCWSVSPSASALWEWRTSSPPS